jgi:hypothetical protein
MLTKIEQGKGRSREEAQESTVEADSQFDAG